MINYARQATKTTVQPATLNRSVDEKSADIWISDFLKEVYKRSQPKKRIRVLINPKSGKGVAERIYAKDVAPLFKAAHCHVEVSTTTYQGEAIDIAEKLDIEAYDAIVACSGDGLIHEIFNGLGKRPDARKALSKLAIAHVPCGSGNGMSCNLYGNNVSPSMAALSIVKGIRTPLDLMSITQGETRILSFLSQSMGIVAEFDLGTENLRWMGPLRFTYGYLIRVMKKKKYPCDLAVKVELDNKEEIKAYYRQEFEKNKPWDSVESGAEGIMNTVPAVELEGGLPALRYGTVNDELPKGWKMIPSDRLGNFYCGNMGYMAPDVNYFPAALPNDGFMDMVCIDGDIGRIAAVMLIPAVENGSFFGLPCVEYRKVLAYRITPKNQPDGYVSIDGERVPWQPFQVEIHKGLGTVLSKNGQVYEAPGPK